MALIEYGMTLCSLCGQPINSWEEWIAFPHFIEDEEDPLWPYSDAVFHRSCFESWPHREEFLARFKDSRLSSQH